MDKTTAQRRVRETFKAPFDKKRYRDFINELCNGIDESKAIPSMGVPDAFTQHIKSCQRLGTFASPNGELTDVLIVQLTESFKLERTRTALRDFVAHKLKRDESYKEAGLVAFVAPDSRSWRFSYVRMEYETRRDPKTGKIKPEERLTPARRYSYLVGEDEECHTAQTRFLALLQNTSDQPTLADIEEAFSVESVTKEFFGEYVRLFEDTEAALAAVVKRDQTIRDDFKEKGVTTIDFAKKLLGQIVFLYFIQKKGWLGVAKGGNWGDGPRNFLRKVAQAFLSENPKANLFNDVLEPLFYDTLATDRGHAAWCKIFACRIPFLNGGLFEPLAGYEWKKTDIDLPNALFTNTTRSAAGDTGTGILDVFDRYNFTVNEAEPLEQEVAIDPEMLGKVFENLIEDNRRKGLGAFYTPREIVHFMCQESLINYLAQKCGTDIPVCDSEKATDKNVCLTRKDLELWIRQSDQFAHYAAAIAAGTRGDHYPKPPDSIRKFAREIDALLRDITVCDPAIGSGAFPVGMMTEIVRARMALTPYFQGDTDIPVCASKDAAAEIVKTRRNLPHWTKEGAIYWITFRLADSLPQEKLHAWKAERDMWLAHHSKPWSEADWKEYDERFGERLEAWLDAGHGSCALSRPDVRQIVQECLLRFDGERLRLHAGVIMPNHVHLLLEPLAGNSLSELLKGIKGASARGINQLRESTGTFWMDESYDHIVRSQAQYEHFFRYIAENPSKASLSPGKFWLHEGDTGIPAFAVPPPQTGMSVSPSPRTAYHFKRHVIQASIYGVDIDPGAVEIAKLRLWLSLVVDEDDVQQIKPLPNLDYKIVVGNSLLGFPFKSQRVQKIEKLKAEYFDETDHDKKLKLRREIDSELSQAFAASKGSLGYEVTFDFQIYFSEIFRTNKGFDVVIANPPYVRQEAIKELKPALKPLYECFTGTADLLVYFYERAVKLLTPGGNIAFITSNKFYRAGYGEKLRGFLARELSLDRLIDFGDAPVFEAIAYASILTGVRTPPPADAAALGYTWEKDMPFDRIAQIVPERGQMIRQDELKRDGWRLESPATLRLLDRLHQVGKPLREFVGSRVYRGITTGFNEAFVVDRATRDALIFEHKSSAELIKPYLRGRDVKRWRAKSQDQWIIFTRRGTKIESYPAIKSYLCKFKKALMPGEQGGRKPGSYEWHEIQDNIAYWQEFEKPKIVSTKISIRPTFALDSNSAYLGNTSYFFPTTTSGRYVLGLLNSSLFHTYAKKVFVEKQGGWFEVQPDALESFPIPAATPEKQKAVERLVDRILAAKARDATADVSALEREIDALVHALYALTPEEIQLVEATAK